MGNVEQGKAQATERMLQAIYQLWAQKQQEKRRSIVFLKADDFIREIETIDNDCFSAACIYLSREEIYSLAKKYAVGVIGLA